MTPRKGTSLLDCHTHSLYSLPLCHRATEMPLSEVVVMNPRRPAKSRAAKRKASGRAKTSTRSTAQRKKAARSKPNRGKTMARRKVARRKPAARRKTTTRRRAAPKRRVARRKTTTRRKAAPKRRKTTRRKTVRRKAAPKRKKTTRRKAAPKRKVVRRKKTVRRKAAPKRKVTSRRKKTSRRKAAPKRRKTVRRKTVRRKTARRKAAPKRRKSVRAKKSRAMKGFSGYRNFVMKHADFRGLGVVTLGLALPTMAAYATKMVNTYLPASVTNVRDQVTGAIPGYNSTAGRAVVGILSTAAVAYALQSYKVITPSEALTANMIAVGMTAVAAAQAMYSGPGSALISQLPATGLAGSSYGYIGAYHGDMSGAHEGMGAELLPSPMSDQMFGVKANVF